MGYPRCLVLYITALVALPLTNATIWHAQNGSSIYEARVAIHDPSTPLYENLTGISANPMVKALQSVNFSSSGLQRRADNELPTGTCAPGTPCANGACCSKTGVCGYAPDQCAPDVCLSNCNAKAECGEYSEGGSVSCPLEVCCSKYGFCGTTDDFCADGCQAGFGTCGSVPEPSCSGSSSTKRTIGYYEGWASQRSCDTRFPSDIDVTAMTHMNFAFVYFHPTTFEIIPMDAGDVALYSQFTALKQKKQSLETWVSIGGWAFNDATNSPNTQTAFSDMSSSAKSRQVFITSLIQFMNTYGFDGVDIDWEYPGAQDRGGVNSDTANFVLLLRDLKTAFGDRYGISVTLPSSYWYLRWFDLTEMENSVDFFNIMSYDIHGVWDSSSKFTGPYVRPHTNMTEIKLGLDLLWRSSISPSKVNLGLGWYGRSFTLKDSSCNTPGCIFSEGGAAGECTKSAGTLSNAEIQRVIATNDLTPTLDREAAVKWITWDSDQWVSYDDGETMQMKISAANNLCLGGTMIWAVDHDSQDSKSSNDLMGIGTANGVSASDATKLRGLQKTAEAAATRQNSCYWSFCGDMCVAGFISETYAKGQVAGIDLDMNCDGDEVKTLCCAPGTNTGTCDWYGWRGVGLPCATGYCPDGSDLVAVNWFENLANSYVDNSEMGAIYDLTCNGGSQSYCCSGFVPSSYSNTDSLKLIGQNGITKRDGDLITSPDTNPDFPDKVGRKGIAKRGLSSSDDALCKSLATLGAMVLGGQIVWAFSKIVKISIGLNLHWNIAKVNPCAKPNEVVAHEKAAGVNGVMASAVSSFGQGAVGPGITEMQSPKLTATAQATQANSMRGPYTVQKYSEEGANCAVTYTCNYGWGFDEVRLRICDNQRWAIEKGLDGKNVFHLGRSGMTMKDTWNNARGARWYKDKSLVGGSGKFRSRSVCEVDEFPLASMEESNNYAYQIVRLVNGPANALHGLFLPITWHYSVWWKQAYYDPCVRLRGEGKGKLPVTWKFSPFPGDDKRGGAMVNANHFIERYGFDSQTSNSECFATYKVNGRSTTASDQGFRALPDDPMYAHPFDWPTFNNFKISPSSNNLPTNIVSVLWLKREIARSVLQQDLPLSAIAETEEAANTLNAKNDPPEPNPTDPATYSDYINWESEAISHQPLDSEIPQETGS
ncbi:glycoside hydrolase, partial [Penicillium paradoxum]|uniref:glycoside hydrolase n=1 Tax=Penicillium paradoxum TaxID=176176 RepID=UPI002547167E